ncbi:WD40-repeat-containing domain protein, partial [Mycena rosella]
IRNGRSDIIAPIVYSPSGVECAESFEGHTGDIMAVLLTNDGYITSASRDATIRFWNPSSGAPVLEPFVAHAKCVSCLASSRDGALLVSGSRDGTASVWDMQSHQMLAVFEHGDWVTCVALSPTSAVVVTGCRDTTVKFWDMSSQRKSRITFRKHTTPITGVIFLEDNIVISSSLDGSIYLHHLIEIWDVRTRTHALGPLTGHKDAVTSVAFSADGGRLVSGSWDRKIRVWDVGTG